MRYRIITVLFLLSCACSGPGDSTDPSDDRFVVLGPSLVELMFSSGLGDRIVGVDRYSKWPPETAEIPRVGGYIDPSYESIASLEPTSIHSSGRSTRIMGIASSLGIPFYSYCFDSLEGVYLALDSLHARYGAGAREFRHRLERVLDSLAVEMEDTAPLGVMIVIYHEPGASSMTVAGRDSFFGDILERVGCFIEAPDSGSWPMVSAEGAVSLDPDHVICLFPGREDSASIVGSELRFWSGLGIDEDRVHCLFEPYMMIPGGRLDRIAMRICSCLL